MAGKARKRWWPVLLVALAVPVASAATATVASDTLGAGSGTPAACDTGAPAIVQNVGTLTNATNIVSVDVSGIASACGGGTVRVAVYNYADTAQEATKAIPAGGGTVNLTLSTPVPLRDGHLVSVTLQGP
jgi:hypothetical protein